MAEITRILQTPTFRKAVKKLHTNQKVVLDAAVRALVQNPYLGEQKKGNPACLRAYKFKMAKQLTLLGYCYERGTVTLELMTLCAHENFYRDVKYIF